MEIFEDHIFCFLQLEILKSAEVCKKPLQALMAMFL